MWPSVQFVERVFPQVIRLATLTLKLRSSGSLTFKGLKLLLEEPRKGLIYVLAACVQARFKELYNRIIIVNRKG